jgi:hypothetical protein
MPLWLVHVRSNERTNSEFNNHFVKSKNTRLITRKGWLCELETRCFSPQSGQGCSGSQKRMSHRHSDRKILSCFA